MSQFFSSATDQEVNLDFLFPDMQTWSTNLIEST